VPNKNLRRYWFSSIKPPSQPQCTTTPTKKSIPVTRYALFLCDQASKLRLSLPFIIATLFKTCLLLGFALIVIEQFEYIH
jgi:hypothetical protein